MREYHAKRQGKKEAQAEAKAHQKDQPRAKYRNKKTKVDGNTFDSKLEAGRYVELKRMLEAGLIFSLQIQVPFVLEVNGILICRYVADFTYKDCDGNHIVEDVKSKPTASRSEYKIKKKLMLAIHRIQISEVMDVRRKR